MRFRFSGLDSKLERETESESRKSPAFDLER